MSVIDISSQARSQKPKDGGQVFQKSVATTWQTRLFIEFFSPLRGGHIFFKTTPSPLLPTRLVTVFVCSLWKNTNLYCRSCLLQKTLLWSKEWSGFGRSRPQWELDWVGNRRVLFRCMIRMQWHRARGIWEERLRAWRRDKIPTELNSV
jgi:hypothetical protein